MGAPELDHFHPKWNLSDTQYLFQLPVAWLKLPQSCTVTWGSLYLALHLSPLISQMSWPRDFTAYTCFLFPLYFTGIWPINVSLFYFGPGSTSWTTWPESVTITYVKSRLYCCSSNTLKWYLQSHLHKNGFFLCEMSLHCSLHSWFHHSGLRLNATPLGKPFQTCNLQAVFKNVHFDVLHRIFGCFFGTYVFLL